VKSKYATFSVRHNLADIKFEAITLIIRNNSHRNTYSGSGVSSGSGSSGIGCVSGEGVTSGGNTGVSGIFTGGSGRGSIGLSGGIPGTSF